ncbi:MAG: hypothetical protein Q9196_004400, partial [Gyalolechia fulgens]
VAILYGIGQQIYEDDPHSVSAKPNLHWWASLVSKIFQSKVEVINTDPWAISEALKWAVTHRITIAADVFCEVFGNNNNISKFFLTKCGVQINDTYFCLVQPCADHLEFVSVGENFVDEDKITRDLIEKLFGKTDCMHMLAMLGLSRYLPRRGLFLDDSLAPQTWNNEEQEEVGREDEKQIGDQGDIASTGLLLGEDLPDREQEELDRSIMGGQEPSFAAHEVIYSTVDDCSTSSRPRGYVLGMEHFRSGEEEMGTDNEESEPLTGQGGSAFQNNSNSTAQQSVQCCLGSKPGFLSVQTQPTPGPAAVYLIDPPLLVQAKAVVAPDQVYY